MTTQKLYKEINENTKELGAKSIVSIPVYSIIPTPSSKASSKA